MRSSSSFQWNWTHRLTLFSCLRLSQSPLCLWGCGCFLRVTGTQCCTPPSYWWCVWSCAWWAPTSTRAPPSPSCCWSPCLYCPSSSAQWWSNGRISSSPTSCPATRPYATTPATRGSTPPLWGTTWPVSVGIKPHLYFFFNNATVVFPCCSWLHSGLQHQLCHVFCHRVCCPVYQLHRDHGWSQHVRLSSYCICTSPPVLFILEGVKTMCTFIDDIFTSAPMFL